MLLRFGAEPRNRRHDRGKQHKPEACAEHYQYQSAHWSLAGNKVAAPNILARRLH
jgi:hypothetical protein